MTVPPITLNDLHASQQQLQAMIGHMDNRFGDLDSKVDSLDNRFGNLEKGLTDLAALVSVGFDTMNDRFDRLEARVDKLEARMFELEARMTDQEATQRDANARLQKIADNYQAVFADIIELYSMATDTKRRFKKQLGRDRELSGRLQKVEVFAQQLTAQTGIAPCN